MSASGVVRYGFDHCRICGKPIVVHRHGTLVQWEQAQLKPLMPEKKWRELGFLAAPTRLQLREVPADGCCAECGLRISKRTFRYHERGIIAIVATAAICWGIFYIISYMRH